MNHLGSGHQYTPMMEHITCMVAIDKGNGQWRDADNDVVSCPIFKLNNKPVLNQESNGQFVKLNK